MRRPRIARRHPGDDDPLCPVCLQPIKSSDMVTGKRDDLMHEQCDHARPPQPPPSSPPRP